MLAGEEGTDDGIVRLSNSVNRIDRVNFALMKNGNAICDFKCCGNIVSHKDSRDSALLQALDIF